MSNTNGMKIKSYFAKSVDAAIAQARVELGSDALLLNTRKLPDGYEVVMGVTGPAPQQVSAPVRPPAAAKIPPAPAVEASSRIEKLEIEKLRAQMDELQGLLERSAKKAWTAQRSVPEVAELHARLIAADVDPVLCKDIADRLEAAMATDAFFLHAGPEPESAQNRWKALKSDPERITNFLRAELESRVVLHPRLGVTGAKGAVAVLVGPSGSGKTTSLAKLAVAASAHRPVRLISFDRARSAGGMDAQQLLSSVDTKAIAFSVVGSMDDLPKLVAEARKKECVLIDTPGVSVHEQPWTESLAAAIRACGDVDVHLVAPAYMKARDLRNTIERYRVFQFSKVLATHLDETETIGTVFSEAAFAGLALSFLSHGPHIPDDIRAATIDDLLAMVQEHPRELAAAHKAA